MTKKRTLSSILIFAFLALDQLSKYFFYTQKVWSETSLLEPLFNTGISWGIAMPLLITLFISLLCILMFGYFFRKEYLTVAEFSLFISWTLGNLIDRLRLGGVRDFIVVGTFPVFNAADIFLTVAVVLLLVREMLHVPTK